MIPLPLETFQTSQARCPRGRKIARRHDAETCGRGVTFVSSYRPCVCLAVEDRFFDAGIELDVTPEIEAVCHMIDVTQDLGLRAIAFGPTPFLLELLREGIRVLHAFDVAATPRIAVPVPGAADAATRLERPYFETELAQTMDRVETTNAGADDDCIKCSELGAACRHIPIS